MSDRDVDILYEIAEKLENLVRESWEKDPKKK